MDVRVAGTFLEVVKTGSFVRAAFNLNITQTAVSARIKVLEDQLDRPLFIPFSRTSECHAVGIAGGKFSRAAPVTGKLNEQGG